MYLYNRGTRVCAVKRVLDLRYKLQLASMHPAALENCICCIGPSMQSWRPPHAVGRSRWYPVSRARGK